MTHRRPGRVAVLHQVDLRNPFRRGWIPAGWICERLPSGLPCRSAKTANLPAKNLPAKQWLTPMQHPPAPQMSLFPSRRRTAHWKALTRISNLPGEPMSRQ